MTLARLVLVILVAASCTPRSGATSISEASESWQSFTGRGVPANTSTYVAGLDRAGTDTWLTESWFTTGHSHTGLFKSNEDSKTWSQVLGWDGWPRWQRHFGADSAVVAAEFEEAGYRLHARLLSTADAGQHWLARDLPVRDDSAIVSIYFVNASDGWLMLGLGSNGSFGCGQLKESVAILRTQDGGATWSEIVRVDAQHPSAGGISIDGAKDGLSFASPTTGYMTTSWLGQGNVAYTTKDGGDSWTRQTLPFDQSPGTAYTSPPTWLSASAGLISVKIGPRPLMGCQIQRSPIASPPPPSPGPWSVEAPSYIVAPNPGSLLLHTIDAGATWSTVAESSQWGDVASIASLDTSHWTVVNGGNLWSTADAGSTWKTDEQVLDPRCSFALARFIDQMTGLASTFCQAVAGEIEGCEHTAAYKSDWDCPPIGNSILVSRDAGHSWSQVGKPLLR
jgi:photosystem II stability/assembly factor-like uncharacterized protein